MKYLVLSLLLALGSWLVFDGTCALITGSHAGPHSGPHAGMSVFWCQLVRAVGLDQLGSTLKMMLIPSTS